MTTTSIAFVPLLVSLLSCFLASASTTGFRQRQLSRMHCQSTITPALFSDANKRNSYTRSPDVTGNSAHGAVHVAGWLPATGISRRQHQVAVLRLHSDGG